MDDVFQLPVTGDMVSGESVEETVPPEHDVAAGTDAADTDLDQAASDMGGGAEQEDPVERYRRQAAEWERRFKGLQGRLQQEIEARRTLEMQRAQLEAQLQQMLLQEQYRDLPEEERREVLQRFMAEQALRQRQLMLQQAEAQMQELARYLTIQILSQRYGVPAEKLAQINDPYAMETVARELAAIRRQQAKEQRPQTRADRFESTNPAPPAAPDSFDEAVDAILRSLRSG